MSSKSKKEPKPKKRQPEKAKAQPPEAAAKPEAVLPPKPRSAPPLAKVMSRHEGEMIERAARGFSMGELDGAGFSIQQAGRLGLAADIRRRTVLNRNVDSLKRWFSPQKQAPVPEPVEEPATEARVKPKKRAQTKKPKKAS